uniref:Uncharacterized protein n=1 Tax=Oryza glumipatula TaxID=40148 RepID=A0A0E0AGV1_9ORYZ
MAHGQDDDEDERDDDAQDDQLDLHVGMKRECTLFFSPVHFTDRPPPPRRHIAAAAAAAGKLAKP